MRTRDLDYKILTIQNMKLVEDEHISLDCDQGAIRKIIYNGNLIKIIGNAITFV